MLLLVRLKSYRFQQREPCVYQLRFLFFVDFDWVFRHVYALGLDDEHHYAAFLDEHLGVSYRYQTLVGLCDVAKQHVALLNPPVFFRFARIGKYWSYVLSLLLQFQKRVKNALRKLYGVNDAFTRYVAYVGNGCASGRAEIKNFALFAYRHILQSFKQRCAQL